MNPDIVDVLPDCMPTQAELPEDTACDWAMYKYPRHRCGCVIINILWHHWHAHDCTHVNYENGVMSVSV